MDQWQKRLVLAVVALVVLIPLGLFAFLLFPPGFMYDHYSTYSYRTTISTNATVENATVLLPVPTGPDVDQNVTDNLWIYDENGTRLTHWNATIVETADGPMLQLHVDQLRGADRYTLWTYGPDGSPTSRREIGPDEIPANMTDRKLVPQPATYSINWQTRVDHDIETQHPIGNASFFSPVTGLTPTDCRVPHDETERCANFTSMVSATYTAESPATVTLGNVEFRGTNEWGFWLSNSYNSFDATTDTAVYTDGRQGWTVVDGRLHAGMGRYDGPPR